MKQKGSSRFMLASRNERVEAGLAPILIVILIAVAVGGYLIYQKWTKPVVVPQLVTQPSFSPVANPVSTDSAEIANWKTYTNTQAGFQVKYPLSYQLIKEDSNSVSFGFKDTVGNGPFEYLVITKNPLIDYRSLEVCANTTNNPEVVADKLPCLTEKISDAKVDGIPAKSFSFTQGVDSDFHVVQTISKPFIQAKMNVSGGGLERDFNQILSTFRFLDQNSTLGLEEIKIIDGNIYKIYTNGEKKLLVDKKAHQDNGIKNFTEVELSPDKMKILFLGQGGIILPFLYYTSLDQINVKYISVIRAVVWSHNSRYIAYTSKPADAGPVSIFQIYDTELDQEVKVANKPKINNLDYDYLGFGKFQWLNDDSGVNISYTAYKFKPNDTDPFVANFGAVVGKGEIVLPLVASDTQ